MSNLQLLLDTDKEFSKYSDLNGPAEAFKKFLANDSIMLPNNQSAVLGIDAIYQSMGPDSTDKITWEPQGGKLSSSKDLGYTWGTYKMIVNGGKVFTGKYLNIWEKQSDDTYKVIVDMGNSGS